MTDRIAGSIDSLPPILQLNPNISRHVALAVSTAMEIQADKRHTDIASLKRALQGAAPTLAEQPVDLPMAHARVSRQRPIEVVPRADIAPQAVAAAVASPALGNTIPQSQPQLAAGLANSPPLPTTLTIPGLNAIGAALASVALISGGLMGVTPEVVFISWIASVLASWHIYRQRGGNPWLLAILAALLSVVAPIAVIWTLFLWPKHAQPAPRPAYRPRLQLFLGLGSLAAVLLVGSIPGLVFFAWYGWMLVAEYMFVSKARRNIVMALTAMLTGPIGVLIAWLIPPRRVAP